MKWEGTAHLVHMFIRDFENICMFGSTYNGVLHSVDNIQAIEADRPQIYMAKNVLEF